MCVWVCGKKDETTQNEQILDKNTITMTIQSTIKFNTKRISAKIIQQKCNTDQTKG